jgi:hypothetical protein
LDEENIEGEAPLWRAVVIQALGDLKLPPSNAKYRRWRHQATKWFMDADENFNAVCECANFPPEKVLTVAYDIISKRSNIEKNL